jgi:cholinesterase
MIAQILKSVLKRQVKNSLTFTLRKVSVKINQGTVKGVIESLPDGKTFQRFSGIPFAKPPVGELRFCAPQKLMKFESDEIDCTRDRDIDQCIQKSLFYRTYVGSEDCLKLNVYVPSDVEKTEKLPVMIFLHGGAFGFGSNNRDL